MRVIFIIHGAKRGLQNLPRLLNSMRPEQCQFFFCVTSNYSTVKQLAYENAGKVDLITVVGGDGLVNECINGLMIYKNETQTEQLPAIATIPVGSTNDFARYYKWKKKSIPDFIARLKKGNFRTIDIPCITSDNGRNEYYINEAGAGLSTHVVKRIEQLPSQLYGEIKFGWAITLGILSFKKRTFSIESPDFTWSGKSLLLTCCNGSYLGGGVCIAPNASLEDQLLDVVIVGDVNIFSYFRLLPKLRKGIMFHHPKIHRYRTNNLRIQGNCMIQKDGELGAPLPCEIKIKDTIRILV